MRKPMIALALSAALFAPMTLAQGSDSAAGPEGREHRSGHHMKARGDQLKQELGLSDEQAAEMRELRESGASREEIRGVLTTEQQAKLDELRSEQSEKRMAHMRSYLALSDEQVAQMREVRENGGGREEMRAILNDEQLEKMDAMHQRRAKGGKGHPRGERPTE